MAPSEPEAGDAAESSRGRRVAIFLDRDGVINRPAPEGSYIESLADFELLPGVLEALVGLAHAGAALFVATNQRGVARGFVPMSELDAMHALLAAQTDGVGAPLAGIYVCPHRENSCDCRKPGVGLFMQARADNPWVDFPTSHLIGDSLSDLQAAQELGMRAWLVGLKRDEVLRAAVVEGVPVAGSAVSLSELVRECPEFRSMVGLS
jgi:D-glycero-D-manno-heptose 1,7-bisphosphate phosphatase